MAEAPWIRDRLDPAIALFDRRARRTRSWLRVATLWLVVSAAATPALLGLAELWYVGPSHWTRAAALVSASVTAVSAMLLLTSGWRESWVAWRHLANQLMREKTHFTARSGEYRGLSESEALDLLMTHSEAMLAEDVSGWSVENARNVATRAEPARKAADRRR